MLTLPDLIRSTANAARATGDLSLDDWQRLHNHALEVEQGERAKKAAALGGTMLGVRGVPCSDG